MATAEHPATASVPQEERPITRTELREELRHYATKADLAQLEVRMANMEARLIRWMIGMMFGGMTSAAAIASLIAIILSN